MDKQNSANKEAWNYRAYEWWTKYNGSPKDAAAEMKKNPKQWIRKHIDLIGEVKGKKILIPLGSNGRKAIPLALLGADVTIVDISEENRKYAIELAEYAGVSVQYIVADFLEWNAKKSVEAYDLVYMEGGILHYFSNLEELVKEIYTLLKVNGAYILNDFHPIRKILDEEIGTKGDYFNTDFHSAPVAYESRFPNEERKKFPKCLLRYWTLSEIITSLAECGFLIKEFREGKNNQNSKLPGDFTVLARK